MRTSLICIAVAFACLAASVRGEEAAAAVETIVPVAVVADENVAALEAAVSADVPLVRSKRGLLLLKKLKLAKLGLVGLGLGAAKVAVVGSVLGGLGGRGGGQQQQVYQPQQQQSYGGGHQGGSLSKRTEYVIEYVPNHGQQQQQHQQW